MQFAIQVGGGQVRHDQSGIDAIVEETQLAESLGFDVVFVPDHYVFESLGTLRTETPAYEMFFVMATLAQRTTRIMLGSGVIDLPLHHPFMVADRMLMLDHLTRGRAMLGIGAGWTRAEFVMMGIEFPDVSDRLRITDEAVTVMRGLWRDEPFTFAGQYLGD
jgi:limonene 1,2-monooxygenase